RDGAAPHAAELLAATGRGRHLAFLRNGRRCVSAGRRALLRRVLVADGGPFGAARARRQRPNPALAAVRAVPQRPGGCPATSAARARRARGQRRRPRVRRSPMTGDRAAAGLYWEEAASEYLARHGVET